MDSRELGMAKPDETGPITPEQMPTDLGKFAEWFNSLTEAQRAEVRRTVLGGLPDDEQKAA